VVDPKRIIGKKEGRGIVETQGVADTHKKCNAYYASSPLHFHGKIDSGKYNKKKCGLGTFPSSTRSSATSWWSPDEELLVPKTHTLEPLWLSGKVME
jgi:hypothetical protein